MTLKMLVLGCLLVAACGAPPPPLSSAPDPGIDMRLDPPPVHALLGHRAALDLTSEQIDALDAVGQQVHAANHPLLMQMQDVERSSGNPLVRHEILTVAGQIHMNNYQAMERVRGILSDSQREEACGLFASSKSTARGLRTAAADGDMRSITRPNGNLHVNSQRQNGPVWSWCYEAGRSTAAR